MSQTWDDIVEEVVRMMRPHHSVTFMSLELLDKGNRVKPRMFKYVETTVMWTLLKARLFDVLYSFDVTGLSFCGFMEEWGSRFGHRACYDWMKAIRPAHRARTWVSHDYPHPRRRTWTLVNVLNTFRSRDWVNAVRVAVAAGVSLGTPAVREHLYGGIVSAFTNNDPTSKEGSCNPDFMKTVLTIIVAGVDPNNLHWDFERLDNDFVPRPQFAWAVPVVDWFQRELKKKEEKYLLSLAACEMD